MQINRQTWIPSPLNVPSMNEENLTRKQAKGRGSYIHGVTIKLL